MKANLISTLRRVALVLAACACATAARAATFTVTTAADEFDTPSGAAVSLREALRDAAAAGGADTITFAPALSGDTITLTSEIVIDSEVTLDASSLPGGLTVSGGGTSRIFLVTQPAVVFLTNLTIASGGATGTDFFTNGEGGAIFNYGRVGADRLHAPQQSRNGWRCHFQCELLRHGADEMHFGGQHQHP